MTDNAKLEPAAAQDVAKTAIHQVLGEDSSVPVPAADHYEDINSKAQRLEFDIEKIENELAATQAQLEAERESNAELVRDLAWHKQYAMRWEKAATVATEALETERKTREDYRKVNPLGGPAKVFDSMADCIRAGDDYYDVLTDFGFCEVKRAESAEARLAEVERHSYAAFFNEVCARAERAMLTSHKLEGMHFMAMKQVKAEWDAAIESMKGG